MLETLENTGNALAQAADEILERMFFMTVDEIVAAPGDAIPEAVLVSEIEFHGAHSGRLRMVVPESCARELAANFTGILDPGQLTGDQIAEVLREFTNMVCGTTLSRLAPQAVFDLDEPGMLTPGQTHININSSTLAQRLKSGNDWIDFYWCWEEASGDDLPGDGTPREIGPWEEAL